MADGVEESERNTSTCAPATAAAWGSITLILRSAADAAASRIKTEMEIPKNRMHSSFVTRKGLVWTVHAGLLACELGHLSRCPMNTAGLAGAPPVPAAISSLTVARQRGIFTRFPPRRYDEGARTKEVVKEQGVVVEKS